MRVLLDTCVLSELRRPKGDVGVRHAIDGFDSESLFVSVLSIGEIAKGIALLRETQNKRARCKIGCKYWKPSMADRLLPVDLETSRILGRTDRRGPQSGADRAGD